MWHVDHRYFKVRKLSAKGVLDIEHINTATNLADILTKPLKVPSKQREAFYRKKHRTTVLNMADESSLAFAHRRA